MYCLDCGSKIGDDEPRCPHCGSSVSEMKRRLAEAEEKLVYSDAVGPRSTCKLPLVSERTYTDKDGHPFDPAQEVDVDSLVRDPADLTAIPEIGDADPFVTMPMQRIVSGSGQVVADIDRDVKEYLQTPRRSGLPVRPVLAVACIVLFVCIGVVAWPQISSFVASQTAIDEVVKEQKTADNSAEASASEEETDSSASFIDSLQKSYSDLKGWRSQTDEVVDSLEGYYRVQNRDTRIQYADECANLLEIVTKSKQDLSDASQDAGVANNTDLEGRYERIDELYDCLIDRLSIIAACWEQSLSFDNPRGHDDEILAPLAQDLKGGSSVSEAQFDELYPKADPSLS